MRGAFPKALGTRGAGPGQRPGAGRDRELQPVYFYDPSGETWGLISQPTGDKLSWVLNSLVPVITQVSLFVLVNCNFSFDRQRPLNTRAKQPCPNTPAPGTPARATPAASLLQFTKANAPPAPEAPAALWLSVAAPPPLQGPWPPACLMLGTNEAVSSIPPVQPRAGRLAASSRPRDGAGPRSPLPPCPTAAQAPMEGVRAGGHGPVPGPGGAGLCGSPPSPWLSRCR